MSTTDPSVDHWLYVARGLRGLVKMMRVLQRGGVPVTPEARAEMQAGFRSLNEVVRCDMSYDQALMVPGVDAANSASFTPESVTSATLRAWYDGDDLTGMFTDDGGSTPVSTVGNTVGKWNSRYGTAPPLQQSSASNRPTYQAVSGATGNGVKFDGSDDYLTSTDATYFDFMHKAAGFTMLVVGAFEDSDSGTIQTVVDSTDNDNAKVGVMLTIRDDGANVGKNYGWIGPNKVFYLSDTTNNSHNTSLLTLLWAWQHGVSGDDAIFRFNGAATFSVESLASPSSSSSETALRLGATSGASPIRNLKMTIRHILFYEGRVSATEIAQLETWGLTQ